MAVSVSAALRWLKVLTSMHTMAVRDGQAEDTNPANFSGLQPLRVDVLEVPRAAGMSGLPG